MQPQMMPGMPPVNPAMMGMPQSGMPQPVIMPQTGMPLNIA